MAYMMARFLHLRRVFSGASQMLNEKKFCSVISLAEDL